MNVFESIRYITSHSVNRPRPIRAFLRYLAWQAGSRLVPGAVVFDWIDGSRFIARPGETGLTGNIYCGLHEFEDMGYVLHVLEPGDCFVDIGANVGSYTILACAVRGASGYSFEPVPSTFERLMDNLRLNDLLGRVTAHNMGLSDGPARLRFSVDENCMNHVLADGEVATAEATIEVDTLDAMLKDANPSMLKIDVEGFETRVLQGAVAALSNPSLHSIVMELNGSGKRYGFDDEDLVAMLNRFGFAEYRYDPFRRELSASQRKDSRSGNAIFVRDVDEVRKHLCRTPKVHIYDLEF